MSTSYSKKGMVSGSRLLKIVAALCITGIGVPTKAFAGDIAFSRSKILDDVLTKGQFGVSAVVDINRDGKADIVLDNGKWYEGPNWFRTAIHRGIHASVPSRLFGAGRFTISTGTVILTFSGATVTTSMAIREKRTPRTSSGLSWCAPARVSNGSNTSLPAISTWDSVALLAMWITMGTRIWSHRAWDTVEQYLRRPMFFCSRANCNERRNRSGEKFLLRDDLRDVY